ATAAGGSVSMSRTRPALPSASSSSPCPRPIGPARSACRPGPRDDGQGAGANARIPHRCRDGGDPGAGRLRARRRLLLRGRAALRGLAPAALACPATGRRADGTVLVVQLRASRPDQAAVRCVAPGVHDLAGDPAGHARMAAAGVRLRRATQLLALPARAVAVSRRRRARTAPLLVLGADVLPRPPRLLRRPHLRHVGGRRRGLAARHRAAAGGDVRPRARRQAQRLVPAPGVARACAPASGRSADGGPAQVAVAPALARRAVRLLAAALARSFPAPARLDRLPHAPRALRLVVLRAGAARAALSRRVPAGARRDGAAAADRGAPRCRRDLASRRLRAAPARIPTLARARPRWRRAAALPALHHADLRWHQALARLRRL